MPGETQVNKNYEKQRQPGKFGMHQNPSKSDLKRGYTGGEKFNGSVTDGDTDAYGPTEG